MRAVHPIPQKEKLRLKEVCKQMVETGQAGPPTTQRRHQARGSRGSWSQVGLGKDGETALDAWPAGPVILSILGPT